MIRIFARIVACLYLILALALSPGFGVSIAQAHSPIDSSLAKVTALLPVTDNLPGGTPISVEITAPSDGAVKVFPPGSVDLEGTASVGMGAIVKETTVVYIMDISGSMSTDAGVDCNGIAGTDTRLVCAKEAVRRANVLAKAATSSVDLTGLGSFEGSAACISTAHDVDLGVAGSQLLVAPNRDGDGNGTADLEQVAQGLSPVGFTCYIGGLERADDILATSTNATNLIFFMSDGDNNTGAPISTFVPANFGSNTRIHAFAMGTGVNCSSNPSGLGSLNDVVAKSTLSGGTCQQVTNLSQLDNLITQALGSTLDSIERQLDGGTFVDITASANPAIPATGLPGPTGNVTFGESNIPAAPGIHDLCVRANGTDGGGSDFVTQCIKVTVADINLSPPTATNDLGVSPTHTVTATVAAGADGGVAGVAVNFDIISGPNAGAVGSGTTDGNGEATFTYTAILGPTGLGTDVIQACFGPDEQGDTACATATKTWVATADLSITKSDSPDPVTAGDSLTYTLTVINNGPGDATGVTVTDTLPTGVTFDPATSSPSCTELGGVVTCDLGDMANGASATVTINVTVDSTAACGPGLINTAVVESDVSDPDSSNNTDSADTTVNCLCTILDDFNRPDGPLGSSWDGHTSGYRIKSNQVAVRAGGPVYWQPEAYGPDQEACVTLTRINPKSKQHGLLLKVQEFNDWRQGAILVSYNARTGNVDVQARDVSLDEWVEIGVLTPPMPVVDGDQLRAKALADGTVEVLINDISIGTADAGSFYAGKGGQIGLWFRGRGGEDDNGDDNDDDHDRLLQAQEDNGDGGKDGDGEHDGDDGDDDDDGDGSAALRALLDDFGGGTLAAP